MNLLLDVAAGIKRFERSVWLEKRYTNTLKSVIFILETCLIILH